MEIECYICGSKLDNQQTTEYLCEDCDAKYGYYDDFETPAIVPMRKRRKYDDER